jgi:hypothetical protein
LFAVLALEINILEEKNCRSRGNPRASYSNCQKSEGVSKAVSDSEGNVRVSLDLLLVAFWLLLDEKK